MNRDADIERATGLELDLLCVNFPRQWGETDDNFRRRYKARNLDLNQQVGSSITGNLPRAPNETDIHYETRSLANMAINRNKADLVVAELFTLLKNESRKSNGGAICYPHIVGALSGILTHFARDNAKLVKQISERNEWKNNVNTKTD